METETTSNSSTSCPRLGCCEVCAINEAKYSCPKCEVKTCSLKCTKIHKAELECNGERDRTKFIPLNKFTNIDLANDFRLLEEITRNVEASKKKYGKRMKFDLPHHLIKLKNAASARKTILKFLPYAFARRKSNTTKLDAKKNLILWHVEWVFVNADNLKMCDHEVPETEKLSSVLHKYLIKQEDKEVQSKLKYYQAVDLPGIKLFLKAEQKAGKKFYELDATTTLKDCLMGKIIIEYPTIHIMLKDHSFPYDVIDSDDEDTKEEVKKQIKSGTQVVDRIIKHAESNDVIYKSLKNLLFISDYSDEEISGGES